MSITRTQKLVVTDNVISLMFVFDVFVGEEPSRIRRRVWKMFFFVIITYYRLGETRCIVTWES
jgi:hypothetical protein